MQDHGAPRPSAASAATPSAASPSSGSTSNGNAGSGGSGTAGTRVARVPVEVPAEAAGPGVADERNRPRMPIGTSCAATAMPAATSAPTGPRPVRSISPRFTGEVFLSPKVVDCEAYHDFAGALKALIDQAGGLLRDLEEQTRAAEAMGDRLRSEGQRHQERLNLGGRLLRTVTGEIERVEEAAKEANTLIERRTNHLNLLESEAEQLVRRFGDRLARAEHEVEDRLEEIGRGAIDRVDEANARLDAMASRWNDLETSVDDRLARVEHELTERLAPVSDRLHKVMREAERLVGVSIASAGVHADHQQTDVGTGDEGARDPGDDPADAGTANEGACGGGDQQPRRTLADVLAEIRPLLDCVDHARGDIVSLQEQWHVMRRDAAEELLTAAELVDTLNSRRSEVETAVANAIGDAEASANRLREQAEECRRQATEPVEAIRKQVALEAKRLDEAEERAASVADRLEHARAEFEELLQLQAEASSRMSRLVEQVEPWKGVLDEVYDDQDLPGPLLRVVDQVTASVGTQLHTLSRVLRAMSSQVERAAAASLAHGNRAGGPRSGRLLDHGVGGPAGTSGNASAAGEGPAADGSAIGDAPQPDTAAMETGGHMAASAADGSATHGGEGERSPGEMQFADLKKVAWALERSVRRSIRPPGLLLSGESSPGGPDTVPAPTAVETNRPAETDRHGSAADSTEPAEERANEPAQPTLVRQARSEVVERARGLARSAVRPGSATGSAAGSASSGDDPPASPESAVA